MNDNQLPLTGGVNPRRRRGLLYMLSGWPRYCRTCAELRCWIFLAYASVTDTGVLYLPCE